MVAQRERGEACLRGEKINVESWGKQEGGDEHFQGWVGIIYGALLFTRLQRSGGASYTHRQVVLKSGKERGTEDWVRHALRFVVHVNAVCLSSRFLQIWGCFTSPACILPFTGGQQRLAHMCSLGINSRGPMRGTNGATYVQRFHSSHAVDCMNIFKWSRTVAFLTFIWQCQRTLWLS